jgi:hypothetical protein
VMVLPSGSTADRRGAGNSQAHQCGSDGWTTARHMMRAGLSLMSSRRRSTAAANGSVSPPQGGSMPISARQSNSMMSTGRRGTTLRGSSITPPVSDIVVAPPPAATLHAIPLEKIFISVPIFMAALRSIKRRQFDEVIAERGPAQEGMPNNNTLLLPAQSAARSLGDVIEAIVASQESLPSAAPAPPLPSSAAMRSPGSGDDNAPDKISEELIDRFLYHTFGVALFAPHHDHQNSSSDSDSEIEPSAAAAAFHKQQSSSWHPFASQSSFVVCDGGGRGSTSKQRFLNTIGPIQLLTSLSSNASAAAARSSTSCYSQLEQVGRMSARGPSIHVRSASMVADDESGGSGMPRLRLEDPRAGGQSPMLSGGNRSARGGGGLMATNFIEGRVSGGGARSNSVSPMPSGRTNASLTPREDVLRAAPQLPPSLLLRPTSTSHNVDSHRPSLKFHVAEVELFEGSWTPENSMSRRGPLSGTSVYNDDDDVLGRRNGSPLRIAAQHSAMGGSMDNGSPRASGGGPSPRYGSTTSLQQMRKDSMVRKAQYNNQLAALKESILSKKMETALRDQQKPQKQPHHRSGQHSPVEVKDREERPPSSNGGDRFHTTHGNANIYALRSRHQTPQQPNASTTAAATTKLVAQPLVMSISGTPAFLFDEWQTTTPLPSQQPTVARRKGSALKSRTSENRTYQPHRCCHSAGIRGPQIAMAIRIQATQELENLAYLSAQ